MRHTLPASSAQPLGCNLTNADRLADHRCTSPADSSAARTAPVPVPAPARRISSASLMGDGRAIEIEHGGRIYQLRITQLNKLILTA